MSAPPVLRHLHLPSITPYAQVSALQQRLVAQFLSHKATVSSPAPPSPLPQAPLPTLITFSSTPVYTTGRREVGPLALTSSQIEDLKKPLYPLPESETDDKEHIHIGPQVASIEQALRGGQTTFHGPGQLVIYPILDLRAIASPKFPRGISPRCYVHLLEETTINTVARWGIKARRTENPGVWIDEDTKIAALGVHLRRNITSYGVGLNVATDLRWFERIIACGLVGKGTTSMYKEWTGHGTIPRAMRVAYDPDLETRSISVSAVAGVWADEFWRGVWGDGNGLQVERLKEEEALFVS